MTSSSSLRSLAFALIPLSLAGAALAQASFGPGYVPGPPAEAQPCVPFALGGCFFAPQGYQAPAQAQPVFGPSDAPMASFGPGSNVPANNPQPAQAYSEPMSSFGPGSVVPASNPQAVQSSTPTWAQPAPPPAPYSGASFGPGYVPGPPGVAVPCAPFSIGGCMPVPAGRKVEPGSALARALSCPAGMSVSIDSAHEASCVGSAQAYQAPTTPPVASFGPGYNAPAESSQPRNYAVPGAPASGASFGPGYVAGPPGVPVPCAPFAIGGCMPVPEGRKVEPGSALAKALVCPRGMTLTISSAQIPKCVGTPTF